MIGMPSKQPEPQSKLLGPVNRRTYSTFAVTPQSKLVDGNWERGS